ncbi:hypothetical protein [Roseivivax marinus]|uniref:hypothetical protein n=1 Tax=Roseivivax marinus TaxID=1379903 RepID=UPI00273D9687|nr:hypothetical protein [Roseivivax marinus]
MARSHQLSFVDHLNVDGHFLPTETLIVAYPGTLFWIAEKAYGGEIARALQMNVLAAMKRCSGNMIVIESRWWLEQDDDFRDVVEELLIQSVARGCLGRRYLEHEESEMYPEWQPIQGDRRDFIFDEEDDEMFWHMGELINGTDITITGGWLSQDIPSSAIGLIASDLSKHCPRSSIAIAHDAFDEDISGDGYLARATSRSPGPVKIRILDRD